MTTAAPALARMVRVDCPVCGRTIGETTIEPAHVSRHRCRRCNVWTVLRAPTLAELATWAEGMAPALAAMRAALATADDVGGGA